MILQQGQNQPNLPSTLSYPHPPRIVDTNKLLMELEKREQQQQTLAFIAAARQELQLSALLARHSALSAQQRQQVQLAIAHTGMSSGLAATAVPAATAAASSLTSGLLVSQILQDQVLIPTQVPNQGTLTPPRLQVAVQPVPAGGSTPKLPQIVASNNNSVPQVSPSTVVQKPSSPTENQYLLDEDDDDNEDDEDVVMVALPRILYTKRDDINISPYQRMIRKQVEIFAANIIDTDCSIQGRNRPIQVG